MDQKKLFYNMCMDLWALGKELDKPRVDMTDEDWTRAIGKMDELTVKYKALGVREHDLRVEFYSKAHLKNSDNYYSSYSPWFILLWLCYKYKTVSPTCHVYPYRFLA